MKTTYGKRSNWGRDAQRKSGSRRQFVQLLVCLALFLVVFIGKEVWPSKVAVTGEKLLAVIRANTDFRSAFLEIGRAISDEESLLGEVGKFCITVFEPKSAEEMSVHNPVEEDKQQQLSAPEISEAEEIQQVAEQVELRVGDVLQESKDECLLPEGYSTRVLFLGEIDTVTPVHGKVTSPFGYREHPTVGRYAVHGGVDIAADHGTAVASFYSGIVEEVGNSDDFGLWLRISHPDGVTTFYSHCSRICVEKGQAVVTGQTVAYVGSTGNSTGPHLHFEVELDGVRLDPMHYIQPEQLV